MVTPHNWAHKCAEDRSTVAQFHCQGGGVCTCRPSGDQPLSEHRLEVRPWRKIITFMFALWLIFHIKLKKSMQRSQDSCLCSSAGLIPAALSIDKAFCRAQYAGYVLQLSVCLPRPAVYWDLFRLRLRGFWKCHLHGARAAWVVIRDGFARTGHKPSFYGTVIVFLSTITVITEFPSLPRSPRAALNRLHFPNGKLSRRYGSGVYKYVKYTFNYFKWIWQLVNKEGRDEHTSDTGHCEAPARR